MLDCVLVECVGAQIFFGREQSKLLARNELQEDSVREQIEQLQSMACMSLPSTSKAIRPKWQLSL
jgi:hypothetical protein